MIIESQKFLTALAAPVCLAWLALIAATILAWRGKSRMLRRGITLALLIYTLAGNGYVSGYFSMSLERSYLEIDAMKQPPFDAVIALGGGTNLSMAGQVQVGGAGDRVITAARLFHAGRAPILIATGTPTIPIDPPRPGPADQARRLWKELGIPERSILTLGGRTTQEEMESAALLLKEKGFHRVGLITSAWHMNRALRLAGAAGLKLEPIPCDFATTLSGPFRISSLLPNGGAMMINERAAKEWLAGWVGR